MAKDSTMNLRVISSSPSVRSAPVLTAEQAVLAARSLAPKFAERAAHAEKIRRIPEESIEELKAKRADAQSGVIDVDEEEVESVELPGADLSGEELALRVVPKQEDEFTCSRCFLIHHASQLAKGEGAKAICKDCA